MIKLVAFDWNGTLLSDTAPTLRAENEALRAVGLKPITILKFRQTFDIPIMTYWKALGLSELVLKRHMQTIEDVFHLNYEKFANQARTRAGAKELLVYLGGHKIQSVIYSNHNIPNIHRQLVRLDIGKFICKILANDIGENKQVMERHKEKRLLEFIRERGFSPRQVISIGDTEEEIQVGKQYGYHTVAITGGYNTTSRLKKQHPDFLIHNLAEVKGIIKKLNNA